ncbi:RNA polymerase sigma factor [Asticcacaulis sp. 201]|uniref:RNA polymerase sigma factor n=1 Tax=Asticcacaulis sp. 201 TaxID=3028787 RepID=UPI0029169A78|nr:RNA polymerase sigma factor [Asticcacaulis sp. 201]MDV6331141.1 RNA polymerase sigma factor [Asticcacaulis sp. 201]
MAQTRSDIGVWVGSNIVPHEAHLRAWLRGMSLSEDDIGDIVQDAYVAIARLSSVDHILNGKAYLFQTAKSVLIHNIRRARIVPIGQLTELQTLGLSDDNPDAERQLSARQELARVQAIIAGLPDRCRSIFEMRRIQGLPQKEIARRLGVSENVVEMHSVRGLKMILKALETDGTAAVRGRRRGTETRGDNARGPTNA